ncbi:probable carboxylesterase 9 [Primulina huaijiensis]|uniref:probable carboxylesterase 9 n=1 Tax=Primulina huaijiensis TaxID=1492673 RepID=UPI003CC6FED4
MSRFDPYEHVNVSLNPDGSLTRYMKLPTSPPTGEVPQIPGTPVLSKDVTLDADKKTWMRIYRPAKLPSNDNTVVRLPIILFFHAGGWIQMSLANTILHEMSNKISSDVPAILVAVDFRLAPENRLPAQYEDAIDAIHWVRNQLTDGDGDRWIRDYGDSSRCYLYGSSCGANIAFNAAMRIHDLNLAPLTVVGIILNQPFFGGKARTRSELKLATDQYFPLPVIDMLWELALPLGTDRDHRFCNPFEDIQVKEKLKSVGRCLVIGFGGDPLIDRQQKFVQMLVEQGVMVEARFDDVGFHGIDMIDTRRANAIVNFIKEFV